ncbi:IS110 family transposase [Acidovorax sp. NCPPB 2350]|nr:IS110 family transposase [Acidovorax sp. NCPPB 2350]WCM92039.1 IS110 family transposase [Acidovorax sp. NCPPB 2350]WCM93915.1 IS110 family transposase [Acidovorax sp. NCPPB 2350]WCM94609.1 IS110 family transposase [Acidovorax sp. NCPPB 2350]
MQMSVSFIGVDVSKAELVIAVHGQPGCQCIANQTDAILAWLRQLPAHARLAVESTGHYHQLFAHLAAGMGLTVFVLNARDVYFYAKGMGARGKTDRLDALIIARYLAEHHAHLRPYRAPSAAHAELDALLGQRWTVTSKRTALREALRSCSQAIAAHAGELDASFKRLLQAIDQRIQALISQHEDMHQGQRLLLSIVGIGPQSSALLACLLSRMSFAGADSLVAYSGLDPRAQDSGRSRGRRRLSKHGRPALRRLIYVAAMSAARTSTFANVYKALRERGFKTTEALVILARKLLRIAFAVWHHRQPFDPHLVALKG